MDTPSEISPQVAWPLLHDSSYVWIDVREDAEWNYGHIPGIQHLPMSSLSEESFSRFPKTQKMIIVCRSGNRSRSVTEALRGLGYTNAQNLSSGMIGLNAVMEKSIPVL